MPPASRDHSQGTLPHRREDDRLRKQGNSGDGRASWPSRMGWTGTIPSHAALSSVGSRNRPDINPYTHTTSTRATASSLVRSYAWRTPPLGSGALGLRAKPAISRARCIDLPPHVLGTPTSVMDPSGSIASDQSSAAIWHLEHPLRISAHFRVRLSVHHLPCAIDKM